MNVDDDSEQGRRPTKPRRPPVETKEAKKPVSFQAEETDVADPPYPATTATNSYQQQHEASPTRMKEYADYVRRDKGLKEKVAAKQRLVASGNHHKKKESGSPPGYGGGVVAGGVYDYGYGNDDYNYGDYEHAHRPGAERVHGFGDEEDGTIVVGGGPPITRNSGLPSSGEFLAHAELVESTESLNHVDEEVYRPPPAVIGTAIPEPPPAPAQPSHELQELREKYDKLERRTRTRRCLVIVAILIVLVGIGAIAAVVALVVFDDSSDGDDNSTLVPSNNQDGVDSDSTPLPVVVNQEPTTPIPTVSPPSPPSSAGTNSTQTPTQAPTPKSTPVPTMPGATPFPTPAPTPFPTPFPTEQTGEPSVPPTPRPTPFPTPSPTPFPTPSPTPFPTPSPTPVTPIGADYYAAHSVPAANWQDLFDLWSDSGYILSYVSCYEDVDGTAKYNAVWNINEDNTEWIAFTRRTPTQLQQIYDTNVPLGYRAVHVDGYSVNGSPFLSVIMHRDLFGPAWEARHDQSTLVFQLHFDDLVSRGYVLDIVSVYEDSGLARYANIFTQNTRFQAWESRSGLTSTEFQTLFDTLVGQGYTLEYLSVGNVGQGTEPLFATLFVQNRPAFQAYHGVTDVQAELDKWTSQGYIPKVIDAYQNSDGNLRWALLFTI